jgi:cytochrome c5
MNRSRQFSFVALVLPVALVLAAAAQAPQTPAKPAKPAHPKAAPHELSAGERVFQQNCSRCHTAPEQLRPSITGTVVRHMRVRASLSEADEKALLQFLAP